MKIYETLQQQYVRYGNVQNLMKFFTVQELINKCHSLKNKASGIDNVTKYDYVDNLDYNIQILYENIRNGTYKPKPIKRCYIQKSNGKLRPLGIPAFQDKIVQCIVADILYSIYDPIFLDCSHGYCLNRNCHTALSSLKHSIEYGKTNYLVKTDLKSFFDNIDHQLLLDMLKDTIKDKHFISLVKKYLNVETYNSGKLTVNSTGTPQGCIISPILGNIYLHYALDLWFETVIKTIYPDSFLVRYCDDFITGFNSKSAATYFITAVQTRLKEYNLTLESSKTDLFKFNINDISSDMFSFLGFNISVNMNKQLCTCASYHKLYLKVQAISDKVTNLLYKGYSTIDCIKSVNESLIGLYNYYGITSNSTWISDLYNLTFKQVLYILYYNTSTRQMSLDQLSWLLSLSPIVSPPHKLIQLLSLYCTFTFALCCWHTNIFCVGHSS